MAVCRVVDPRTPLKFKNLEQPLILDTRLRGMTTGLWRSCQRAGDYPARREKAVGRGAAIRCHRRSEVPGPGRIDSDQVSPPVADNATSARLDRPKVRTAAPRRHAPLPPAQTCRSWRRTEQFDAPDPTSPARYFSDLPPSRHATRRQTFHRSNRSHDEAVHEGRGRIVMTSRACRSASMRHCPSPPPGWRLRAPLPDRG